MTNSVLQVASPEKRLDLFVCEKTELTRSRIKKLIEDNKITLNGKPCKAGDSLKAGDVIEIALDEPVELDLTPQDISIDIVYQDDDLAVINKPQGLTVHAGGGTNGGTLVNALLYHLDKLSSINGVIRPGIVHRIDKDTSGLLVVAKNDTAHLSLAKQIEKKTCKRIYLALVEGAPKCDNGLIDTLITRSDKDRKLMAVSTVKGRQAVTEYTVIKKYQGFTLMEFSLKTGRTHQIRVHCKHLNLPIVGDKKYGSKKQKFELEGQLLHAHKLTFIHPRTGEEMTFTAPLPKYFTEVLSKLKEK